MTSNQTLEDFIKNYISNKSKSNTPQSYREWLSSNGLNGELEYSESLRRIGANYMKSKSGYGATAERLGNMGLSSAGYRDYIDKQALDTKNAQAKAARSDYLKSAEKGILAYADYTKAVAENEKKTYKSTVKEIIDAGIVSYEKAYELASTAGLSESRAKEAAESATATIRKSIKEQITKQIVSKSLTEAQTYEYAISMGLSESDAKELAAYAKSINDIVTVTDPKDYLDKMKNDLKNKQYK